MVGPAKDGAVHGVTLAWDREVEVEAGTVHSYWLYYFYEKDGVGENVPSQ